ncbi:MAG: hypothetical protein RL477_2079, partial [Pseudomonadota bacterium]
DSVSADRRSDEDLSADVNHDEGKTPENSNLVDVQAVAIDPDQAALAVSPLQAQNTKSAPATIQAAGKSDAAEMLGASIESDETAETSPAFAAKGNMTATENKPGAEIAQGISNEIAKAPKSQPAHFKDFATSLQPTEILTPDTEIPNALVGEAVSALVRKSGTAATNAGAKNELGEASSAGREGANTSIGPDRSIVASVTVAQEHSTGAVKPLHPMPGHGLLAAQEIDGVDFSLANAQSTAGASGASTVHQTSAGNIVSALNAQNQTANGAADNASVNPGLAISSNVPSTEENRASIRPNGFAGPQALGGLNGIHSPANGITGGLKAAHAPSTTRNPAPVPLEDVAVHIARAASSGSDQITIKLKPAALGQIDVKLELTDDGRVAAVVTADRADTLDMLARDAKSLERALADAGLKADSGSLQFNLRGEGQGHGHESRQAFALDRRLDLPNAAMNETPAAPILSAYSNARIANGGVDIRV